MHYGPYDERLRLYKCEECSKEWQVKEELWVDDHDGSKAWFGLDGCDCGSDKTPVNIEEL